MASKGDPMNKGAAKRASFRPQAEFVRYTLSDAEKALIKGTSFPPDVFVDKLHELVEAGYKVTFRWDDFGDCHGCWFIPSEDDLDNKGLILAGRGSTADKAFKQALFMHEMIFEKIWPKPTGTSKAELDD